MLYFMQSISPGYVKTEIMGGTSSANLSDMMKDVPALESEDIAESVIYVLGTPPRVQITELTIRPLGETF